MTTAAFEQTVTDAINVRLLDAHGQEQEYTKANARLWGDIEAVESGDNVGPHIAKIPLRAEYRALMQAAEAYEANAERLKLLAKQARDQAANLKSKANL